MKRCIGLRGWFSVTPLALLIVLGLSGSDARAVESNMPAASPAPQTPAPAGRGSSPFVPPEPLDYADRTGWTSIFDGRTLTGWSGNPDVWSVENGAITATSTTERRVGSTHIIWAGGEPADFELKLEVKLEGDIHSGIAYRSFVDAGRGTAGRQGGAHEAEAPVPLRHRSPRIRSGRSTDLDWTSTTTARWRGTSKTGAHRGGRLRGAAAWFEPNQASALARLDPSAILMR